MTLPYKGLAAYQADDAPLFFGRTELVDQLVTRLVQHRVLVIGGASGSGKSSLLRAGLLPRLAAGALPGSQQWEVHLFSPGDRPLEALRTRVPTGGDRPGEAPDRELVIAIDQFEELFTLCGDPQEREGFVQALADLADAGGRGARIVLAVRADFYGTCAEHPWLAEAINGNQVLVGPMSSAQLREAIEGPARRVGLHLEEGLVERFLADAGTDGGALPLVAHALVETWVRRDGNLLTLKGYEAAGGVAGAIGRTADQAWERLDSDQRRTARQLLVRLVHPGDGTPDTKRLLPSSEIGDDPATRLVLDRFSDSRLLTADEQGVQLAHEALLRTWSRLAGWLDESREELRAAERIDDAAREWERADRHADLLYRGVPLEAALDWRARYDGALSNRAAAFLEAARTARDAERSAAQAQARRSRRVRRRAVSVLATLTALAVATSVVAGVALQRSRRDSRAARAAEQTASQQLARSLGATASGLAADNPYLATILAAEAITRGKPAPPQAKSALVQSRLALAGDRLVPIGDPVPVGDALTVALRPAGDIAATGDRRGGVALWDTSTHQQVATLRGPSGGVQGLAFTADGRWLVGATADNALWRWDVGATGRPASTNPVDRPRDLSSIGWGVAASPVGTVVAALTEAGRVWLVDASSGGLIGDPIDTGGGELLSAVFSADGKDLLVGSAAGKLYGWDVATRRPLFAPIQVSGAHVWELTIGRGSTADDVVAASGDGKVSVRNIRTGQKLPVGPFDQQPAAMSEHVKGVTFAADPSVLTLGGEDGAVYSWSLTDRRVLDKTGAAHENRISAAARSSNGRVLVTVGDDQRLQVWSQRARPAPVTSLAQLGGQPSGFALAPGERTLAAATDDGTVHLLAPATGRELGRLTGQTGATVLAFSGADRLVTGDAAGTLRLWDLGSRRVLAERRDAHAGGVTALSLGTAPGVLASGGADRLVRLWDPGTLQPRGGALSPPLPAPVTDVNVAGTHVAASAGDSAGTVERWTTSGAALGQPVSVTGDAVWAVAQNGDALAAAAADEVVTLYDGATGPVLNERHELGSHVDGALAVVFVDPSTIAVTAADGELHLWDVATGEPLGPAIGLSGTQIRHVAAAADGTIWTAAKDGTISRVDALSLSAACADTVGVFDARQRIRLLAGQAPTACATSTR